MDQCTQQHCTVSESLVAFMVKAAVLDPQTRFGSDSELTSADVQVLTDTVTKRLLDAADIGLHTVRLQSYMDSNFLSRNEIFSQSARELALSLEDVHREICDSHARSRDELEAVYRKLIFAVMISTRLGSPTNSSVVREATAAFESVLPPSELGSFVALDRNKKLLQLQELSSIVSGIRLYNKFSKKGGASIPDLAKQLPEAVLSLLAQLRSEYTNICGALEHYTAWLLVYPSSSSFNAMQKLQRNLFQYVIYLEIMLEETCCSSPVIRKVAADVQAHIAKISTTVQSKTAIPTAVIYPLFSDLAKAWTCLQNEQLCVANIVAHITNLGQEVMLHSVPEDIKVDCESAVLPQNIAHVFKNMVHTYNQGVSMGLAEECKSVGPVGAAQLELISVPADKHLEFLAPSTTYGVAEMSLLIGGFCPVYAATRGTLIPANRSLGFLRYNGGTYGFASADAARQFAQNIDVILGEVILAGRKAPDLIDLLDLHAAMVTGGKSITQAFAVDSALPKCDSGSQTDLHPMDRNVDKNYDWNEWALRRKAIHLTNLRGKITHSVQTDSSAFRRENTTQVYLPKTNETQTKSDQSTSIPRPTVFVRGLRGDTGDKKIPVQVVDLTLGIGGVAFTRTTKK